MHKTRVCVRVNGVNVGLYAELQTCQQILFKFVYKLLNTCDNISVKMSSVYSKWVQSIKVKQTYRAQCTESLSVTGYAAFPHSLVPSGL